MSQWGWFPEYTRPPKRPPPEHGIKVKKVGTTWWGKRWIEALENLSREYSNRLPRGRTYARAGRVHDLTLTAGEVAARVTGSHPTPYTVTVRIPKLNNAVWSRAIQEMAGQALFSVKLLAGEMPQEIDQAFREAGASLFPAKAAEIKTECSCPDWANPCKHLAATHYVLGEAFDKDPFLLFELRGRTKDQVMDALRESRSGEEADSPRHPVPESDAIPTVSFDAITPDAFERLQGSLATLRFRIEEPVLPGVLPRQIGAPPAWSLDESASDLLGPIYQAASRLALSMAWESEPPA